ncbi:MAG: hypothetical protein ACI9OE_001916 [Mariniflexile sp.]|jgi:hypothetical protein
MKNIELLKNSPLFNLSLSSKELFHSNFIAWVADIYPKSFGKILSEKFEIYNSNSELKTPVSREKNNLDLIFEFKDGTKIIIENKVKSIPNKEQLINYYENNNLGTNNKFILLTLIPPAFDVGKIGWETLTYSDLAKLFKKLILEINDPYHISILNDYITFICCLSDLISPLKNLPTNYDFNLYSKFYQVRLHDLYIKYIFTGLKEKIHESLKSKLGVENVFVDRKYDGNELSNLNKAFINFAFVKGKGVISIDYSNQEGITYGIMLDGDKYLHYIWAIESKEDLKVMKANEFREKEEWFTFESRGKSYPKVLTGFNKFGKSMIYRSVKIKKELSIDELINDWIDKDIDRMQNLKLSS